MNIAFNPSQTGGDPIDAVLNAAKPCVLAVIVGVEGPSYRPLGAMMAVLANGDRIGTLSSGCIEADIALHAAEVLATNAPRVIRYGIGSPFMDIELPCGGGLDILLLPNPDKAVLQNIQTNRTNRRGSTLNIDLATGGMSLKHIGETARAEGLIDIRFDPDIRFLVFGKGPEAATFAALVHSAGYPLELISPDEETLQTGARLFCPTHHLQSQSTQINVAVDKHTCVVLFFHDHDWEPPILQWALGTEAFYIGSQGSRRARQTRDATLQSVGVSETDINRLHGPIGLIPSARDAGTLAVSVLAEILAEVFKQ